MLPVLTRKEILGQRGKFKTDYVEIEGVGRIRVRELKASERRDFDIMINRIETVDPDHIWEFLAQCGMIDETGRNLFTEDDRDILSEFGSSFITPIAMKVRRLSGMDEKMDDTKSKDSRESSGNDDVQAGGTSRHDENGSGGNAQQ